MHIENLNPRFVVSEVLTQRHPFEPWTRHTPVAFFDWLASEPFLPASVEVIVTDTEATHELLKGPNQVYAVVTRDRFETVLCLGSGRAVACPVLRVCH